MTQQSVTPAAVLDAIKNRQPLPQGIVLTPQTWLGLLNIIYGEKNVRPFRYGVLIRRENKWVFESMAGLKGASQ